VFLRGGYAAWLHRCISEKEKDGKMKQVLLSKLSYVLILANVFLKVYCPVAQVHSLGRKTV
jgi:hypothetical protein